MKILQKNLGIQVKQNGKALVLGENDELPVMEGEIVPEGTIEVAPAACVFISI